jgi:hypothetical protein
VSARGAKDGDILAFQGGTISYSLAGIPVVITVPNGTLTFSAAAERATTSFDSATQTWNTVAPLSASRHMARGDDNEEGQADFFLTGVSIAVETSIPGDLENVTWSGSMATNDDHLVARWGWSAASFSKFSTDYNALGVLAAPHQAGHDEADPAGTPESFVGFATGGGTIASDEDHSTRRVTVRFSPAYARDVDDRSL